MRVDPFHFTKFDRTEHELEEMLVFSVMVAGKRADQTVKKVDALMACWPYDCCGPFDRLRILDRDRRLGWALRKVRIGQYRRLERALRGILTLDPRTCSLVQLEAIPGIGPKTARMFLMHSRPGQRLACLDTHVLSYMRAMGVQDVPQSTPPAGPTYRRLEAAFLDICDRYGVTPEDLDLRVWRMRTISQA